MTDPYPIVPRDAPIPVTARRPMPSASIEAQPPPAVPAAPAPQIIYINTIAPPAAQQPPPPAPLAPVQNHYTTTHHHTYRTPRTYSNSALGMASLALGIIASVICWIPLAGLAAVPIGAIGAAIGILGVLVSILFRRSSAGLPVAGVFVCCLAGGISIASTKSLPYWKQQLEKAFPPLATHSSPTPPSLLRPVTPPDPAPSAPSIFDPSPAPTIAPPPPAVVKQAPPAKQMPPPPKMDPAIASAADRLAAAERACEARVKQTVEYQEALKSASDARAHVGTLRQSSPGSSDLKDASQAMIDADNAVTDVITRAKAADPDVNLARRDLAAAKSKSTGN